MRKWLPLILALALCLMCTAAMAECEHAREPGNTKLVANTDGTHSHVCTVCGETLESYDVEWIPEESRPSGRKGHFPCCPE